MPTIFTHPDFNPNRHIKKILITNVTWTDQEISNYLQELSDKEYEIYVHRPEVRDIQWLEGVRTMSQKVYDYRKFSDRNPVEWLKEIDDAN